MKANAIILSTAASLLVLASSPVLAQTVVVGNVSSGATDSGDPVKIGGVYNSTPPTLATGQRGDLQVGTRGALAVTLFNANSLATPAIGTTASDANSVLTGMWGWSQNLVFNGATWARQRGGVDGTNVQGAAANGSALAGNPVLIGGSDGTNARSIATTTSGALAPPTAASGKITEGVVTLATGTNTQIVAANANRIALEIQCDGGPVKVSRTGATLTSSALATGPAGVILSTANLLYTFPVASLTAVTGYQSTGATVTCSYADYSK